MIPYRVVFLNPWDRLIGPNRYLVEILRQQPDLAARSLVALPSGGAAADEYRGLGCETAVWDEVALVHPRWEQSNLRNLARVHTRGLARVVAYLRAERPSVVVSNAESILVGSLASRWLGLSHAQVFHGITFHDRLGGRPLLLKAYARLYDTLNKRIIMVSKTSAGLLERAGVPATKIAVVPNPIVVETEDTGSTGANRTDWPLTKRGSPLIVTAGRISPMKGQDLLVEALPRVVEDFPSVLCVFAGRIGSDAGLEDTVTFMRNIERRVDALGIGDHVCFSGEMEPLENLLRQADLYIQPSRTESFGRVVAEALGCGTPVVGFAVGGIAETAGPGAVLVEPANSSALAEAILRALRSPEEMAERAARGRDHVRKSFSAPEVARTFRCLLEELAAGAR